MDSLPQPLLVAILGPAAVGKMTVGQETSRRTGLPLYHNHRLSDFLTDFFPWGTRSYNRLADEFNRTFFEEAIASGLRLIWTWGWAFDQPHNEEDLRQFTAPWFEKGGAVYWVELTAPLEVRLERNASENRRAYKKTDWCTEERLRWLDAQHRWNSDGDFPAGLPHLQVDTTDRTAPEVADLICAHFALDAAP